MTKDMALYAFYSGFGLPAYDENTVPDEAELPYITYQVATSDFDNNVMLSASLWYRSTSWAEIQDKADEINDYIGRGGVFLPFDGGAIWLRRGSPFSQRMDEPSDNAVRRILLNLTAEYVCN